MINREAIDLAILDYAIEKRRGIICSSNHEDGIERIDLMHYCDRGPLTVHPHTTVARAYMVFRKLGLRHLPGNFKRRESSAIAYMEKHFSLTFVFLLPLSYLFHCLCHVSPLSKTPKQVFF